MVVISYDLSQFRILRNTLAHGQHPLSNFLLEHTLPQRRDGGIDGRCINAPSHLGSFRALQGRRTNSERTGGLTAIGLGQRSFRLNQNFGDAPPLIKGALLETPNSAAG